MNRRQFIKQSTLACGAAALLPGRVIADATTPAQAVQAGTALTGPGVHHVLSK